MSSQTHSVLFAFVAISLITINGICADLYDNEVGDIPLFHVYKGVQIYQGDSHCILVGGLCVHHSDCLEPTSTKGLCPSNAHLGVECCYELPLKPAPCEQHQGICRDRCPKTLTRPGTDCGDGVCCVLV